MKIVYPDGTYTQSPVRSVQTTKEERSGEYSERGMVAFENGEYLKSDIYFEWARLELLED